MGKQHAAVIAVSIVLILITIFDIVIAINNMTTGNVPTGILLLVMAAILLGAAIRNIVTLLKNR